MPHRSVKMRGAMTGHIETHSPQFEADRENFRSIILLGKNAASYKFSLGKSLLELARDGSEVVSIADLAVPFARNICEHLLAIDRQGTAASSRFLDACRFYNEGSIKDHELRDVTIQFGFENVIDAFHVVGDGDVSTRFFVDERQHQRIRLTDDLLNLAQHPVAADLASETEARWRLVEEAWDGRATGRPVRVLYNRRTELLVPALLGKRQSITEIRPALNGYQQGHCFYCFRPIQLNGPASMRPDVDHFLPFSLMTRGFPVDLDHPWNLVLACQTCNRGSAGKFAHLPHSRYIDRLHRRNEHLIQSHHPLRETLIEKTGASAQKRLKFLTESLELAGGYSAEPSGWTAEEEQKPLF